MLLTSAALRPSAATRCWSMLTLRLATSGQLAEADRRELGIGATPAASSRSRASANCSRLRPPVFCSSMVKPVDWPRPRIAPGTSAKTCASRRPRNAPRGALDDRLGAVLRALALVVIGEVEEGLAGILAGRALAAAGDGEEGLARSSCRGRAGNSSRPRAATCCVRVIVAPAGRRNWTSAAPWSSVGRKPVGSRKNSRIKQRDDDRVDAEEQPFAVDDPA